MQLSNRFKNKAFSLIELMIVVAIIVAIVAVAGLNQATRDRRRMVQYRDEIVANIRWMLSEARNRKQTLVMCLANAGFTDCETQRTDNDNGCFSSTMTANYSPARGWLIFVNATQYAPNTLVLNVSSLTQSGGTLLRVIEPLYTDLGLYISGNSPSSGSMPAVMTDTSGSILWNSVVGSLTPGAMHIMDGPPLTFAQLQVLSRSNSYCQDPSVPGITLLAPASVQTVN